MQNKRIKDAAAYYCEGETKGNITASMKRAGYSDNYSEHKADRMGRYGGFREAVKAKEAELEAKREDTEESIDQEFKEIALEAKKNGDLVNWNRSTENRAKHQGYYKADNEQGPEQVRLDAKQAAEAQELARLRLRRYNTKGA